ncbi:DUF5313 family protein [Aldersonia kunmingensis]|uniref:DUF5313 family protein n=1 Tax=Aldersonia kunmingensis TaxID=408066 RepID=UPI00082B67F3|nr:DUF5313 family protein [Aldersonia kunmingensis]
MFSQTKPTWFQRVRYVCGATLPDSMREWVLEDQTGPGATRRYLLRFLLPMIPVLSLFLLVPGPSWMGPSMMALLFIPLVYFTIALTYVYRRSRLVKHGLDPELARKSEQAREDAVRSDYERRHGR